MCVYCRLFWWLSIAALTFLMERRDLQNSYNASNILILLDMGRFLVRAVYSRDLECVSQLWVESKWLTLSKQVMLINYIPPSSRPFNIYLSEFKHYLLKWIVRCWFGEVMCECSRIKFYSYLQLRAIKMQYLQLRRKKKRAGVKILLSALLCCSCKDPAA